MLTQAVRYNFRAYPDIEQSVWLWSHIGAKRVVQNNYIEQMKLKHEKKIDKILPWSTRSNVPEDKSFLLEYSTGILNQAVRDEEAAFKRFFSKTSKYPKYHKRPSRPMGSVRWGSTSLAIKKIKSKWAVVRLPKAPKGHEWLKFKLSRLLPSEPSSVTFILNPDGTYEVSFVVKVELPDLKFEGLVTGVDFGLKDLIAAVSDNGDTFKIPNEKLYHRLERKIAHLDGRIARSTGEQNKKKLQLKRAKLYSKITRTRNDKYRKLALDICRENQAVAVERLNLAGLSRSRLSKSFSDAALGALSRFIEEAGRKTGCRVVQVNPAYTTQTCSVCGNRREKKLPLSKREWICEHCGCELDRDLNAAANILLAAGLAESVNDHRGNVRPHSDEAAADEVVTTFRAYQPRQKRLRAKSLEYRAAKLAA